MSGEIQLDHIQLRKLWDALLDAYPNPADFDRMLFFRTGRRTDNIASVGATFQQRVYDVIVNAQSEHWMQDLAVGAHKDNPLHASLRAFVAATFPDAVDMVGATVTNVDPTSAYFLREDRSLVFINRRDLRRGLQELVKRGSGPRILAVHSDLTRCGKTYTAELIRYVAHQRQEKYAYIDLREEISLGNGLQELVEQLGRKLGADIRTIPEKESLTARWVKNLVLWLLDQVNRSQSFWWIVFDSINQVSGLPNDVHDFISRFARQLEEEFDPACRLVLLSYRGEDQLPPDIGLRVVQDYIVNELGCRSRCVISSPNRSVNCWTVTPTTKP
ncbi:MAG: effector-associated domain EAD1-containing protein [Caldilineaceae bacterium]